MSVQSIWLCQGNTARSEFPVSPPGRSAQPVEETPVASPGLSINSIRFIRHQKLSTPEELHPSSPARLSNRELFSSGLAKSAPLVASRPPDFEMN